MRDRFYSWKPSAYDKTPPINPWNTRDCIDCQEEAKQQRIWTSVDGTADEWIEILFACTSLKECIDWWQEVRKIYWKGNDIKEERKLIKAYLKHAGHCAMIEHREYKSDYEERFKKHKAQARYSNA
jgi:hypothetical protein